MTKSFFRIQVFSFCSMALFYSLLPTQVLGQPRDVVANPEESIEDVILLEGAAGLQTPDRYLSRSPSLTSDSGSLFLALNRRSDADYSCDIKIYFGLGMPPEQTIRGIAVRSGGRQIIIPVSRLSTALRAAVRPSNPMPRILVRSIICQTAAVRPTPGATPHRAENFDPTGEPENQSGTGGSAAK